MAFGDNTARALANIQQAAYRQAPHNLEAEQALLGAILVNNEAFYRVSDFLKPDHFHERIHQEVYKTVGELIRLNKVATPVTLKTFLNAEVDLGGITLPHYLARLAADAGLVDLASFSVMNAVKLRRRSTSIT